MRRIRNKKWGRFLWPDKLLPKCVSAFKGDDFSADEREDSESDFQDDDTEYDDSDGPSGTTTRVSFDSPRASFASPIPSANDDYPQDKGPKTLTRGLSEIFRLQYTNIQELLVAVGTWNVAGKPPLPDLQLDEWLEVQDPADMYVIGFQEIVPLSASNVLGSEDYGPAAQWEALIRQTLGKAKESKCKCYTAPPSPRNEVSSESSDSCVDDTEVDAEHVNMIDRNTSFNLPGGSPLPRSGDGEPEHADRAVGKQTLKRVNSSPHDIIGSIERTQSQPADWLPKVARPAVTTQDFRRSVEEDQYLRKPSAFPLQTIHTKVSTRVREERVKYVRVASKQMVGIHVSVWVRRKLRRHIRNARVSCVGIGLMGYFGNKGSVSVSLTLHQTTFCFVCTHLSHGEKDGDELRRNADVMEILRRTRFPSSKSAKMKLPKTILEHDRAIWLGDLNYRLNLSDSETRSLVARRKWKTLLENDQLKKELIEGKNFEGWREGSISFAPTYKYEMDSHEYIGDNSKDGEKRRAPAWCDRILCYGRGMRNLSYKRVVSKFSDHRPVNAMFLADIEVFSEYKLMKTLAFKNEKEEFAQPHTHTGFRKARATRAMENRGTKLQA